MAQNIPAKKEDATYDTNKSYRELVYGKYFFIAKAVAIVLGLIFIAYILINYIGRSLEEEKNKLSSIEFMSLPQKQKESYRDQVRYMLLDDIIEFRQDTAYIIVDDDKYLLYKVPGNYEHPEERMIYGCRLHCLELALKRAFVEMQFPFLYTLVKHKDSVTDKIKNNYTKYDAVFPLYITNNIKPEYTVKDTSKDGTIVSSTISIPDSIVDFFNDIYKNNIATELFEKYIGSNDGDVVEYKNYTVSEFKKLSEKEKKDQRRAFLNLSEKEQKEKRNVHVKISKEFGCYPVDEETTDHFDALVQKKLHEIQVTSFLVPYFNMATMSLLYPMAKVENVSFPVQQNNNSLLLVALKSGRAPAHYILERKDSPRVIEQGMFADITDYISNWEQFKYFPKLPMSDATYKGRYYAIPRRTLNTDAIQYRRDWLEKPEIFEWIKKKGWIHPKDNKPYIPFNWTYQDFKTLAKLYTDADTTGKVKGFIAMPGAFHYLYAHSLFHIFNDQYIKPDPTGEKTWVFFENNPILKRAFENVKQMYWRDKSVRSGVGVDWSSMAEEFKGGRAGMSITASRGVPYISLMQKYTVFGREKKYSEIVGLTSIPGSGKFPNYDVADCNLVGFNPFLSEEELIIALEWIKESYYGEFVNNSLFFEVKEARIRGSESVVFRDAIASTYKMDYSMFDVEMSDVFPPHYIEYFDNLRETQNIPAPPQIDAFGLTVPVWARIMDRVDKYFFGSAITDSTADFNKLMQETASYVNKTVLNYKDDNSLKKHKKYYAALLGYYQKYVPGYYALFKAKYEKYLKYW